MGFLDKVKGALNIGGVSVKITQVEDPFPRDDTVMRGRFTLSTKTDKTVLSTKAEFYQESTTGEGEEKKTSRTSLGSQSTEQYLINADYPFELAAGESRDMSFLIHDVNMGGLLGRMSESGGMLGAVGKLGSFAGKLTSDKEAHVRYYVEVTADVKGTPFDPSDKVEIRVILGKS